jgi:hypothetical protein
LLGEDIMTAIKNLIVAFTPFAFGVALGLVTL